MTDYSCLTCGNPLHRADTVCSCITQGGGDLWRSDSDDDTDYSDRGPLNIKETMKLGISESTA